MTIIIKNIVRNSMERILKDDEINCKPADEKVYLTNMTDFHKNIAEGMAYSSIDYGNEGNTHHRDLFMNEAMAYFGVHMHYKDKLLAFNESMTRQ